MKQLSLILNIVLIIAVAYLYYFTLGNSGGDPVPVSASANVPVANDGGNDIVYINSDSLLNNYDYFISMSKDLEKKQDSIDALLQRRARLVENEIMEYQKAAPS